VAATGEPVTTSDAGRIEHLEREIRELQTVYAQLAAYAKDLNRTYVELRLRLQQMTTLSALGTRLARARNVDTATRVCIEGLLELFPASTGYIYLEDRHQALKLVAAGPTESDEALAAYGELASTALTAEQPVTWRNVSTSPTLDVVAVALRARGKALGSLVVRQHEVFGEDDIRVVELLGNHAAVTISNARLYQQTRRLAITDPLTGLYNLRHFRSALAQEIQKAKRLEYPIAVIMADIDHFKAFNDTYGHPKGNVVLRKIAQVILQNLRQTDLVARYGGEEFSAILPGCDQPSLLQVAEKVRQAVERRSFTVGPDRKTVHLTISIGGAWQDPSHTDAPALLATADQALYTAKATGRNRSMIRTD
jgi:two-component system, cell cycle response regulator